MFPPNVIAPLPVVTDRSAASASVTLPSANSTPKFVVLKIGSVPPIVKASAV